MQQFNPSIRRKLERSSSNYYQRFINGDSIYTACADRSGEREIRPTTGRTIVQPFRKSWKSLLVEHGPWLLSLEAVLDHRDQDRHRLWERQRKRDVHRAARRSSRTLVPSYPEKINPLPPIDEIEVDRTTTSRIRTRSYTRNKGTSNVPAIETTEIQSRAVTPELPSSDLVRAIHHEAMTFYDARDVLALPPPRAGRKPVDWEEPIAMARAFDGTALMAIAVLLEEIVKDQVLSSSSLQETSQ